MSVCLSVCMTGTLHVVDICPCSNLIPVCLTMIYQYYEEKILIGYTWGVQEQTWELTSCGPFCTLTLFCH